MFTNGASWSGASEVCVGWEVFRLTVRSEHAPEKKTPPAYSSVTRHALPLVSLFPLQAESTRYSSLTTFACSFSEPVLESDRQDTLAHNASLLTPLP